MEGACDAAKYHTGRMQAPLDWCDPMVYASQLVSSRKCSGIMSVVPSNILAEAVVGVL